MNNLFRNWVLWGYRLDDGTWKTDNDEEIDWDV